MSLSNWKNNLEAHCDIPGKSKLIYKQNKIEVPPEEPEEQFGVIVIADSMLLQIFYPVHRNVKSEAEQKDIKEIQRWWRRANFRRIIIDEIDQVRNSKKSFLQREAKKMNGALKTSVRWGLTGSIGVDEEVLPVTPLYFSCSSIPIPLY
jgi:hypothetical protein